MKNREGGKRVAQIRGFTLIELIMSLAIITIMAFLAAPLLGVSVDAVNLKMNQANINELAQLSIAKMTRDIRRLRNIQSIQTATATDLVFVDRSDKTIRYNFVGTNLMYDFNGLGSQVLSSNLQAGSSAFTYFDGIGNELASPVGTPSNIRRVQVRLVYLRGTQTYTVQTQIRLRNVPAGVP